MDHSHILGNDFLYAKVTVPFVKPWPTGIACFVVVVIAFTIGVVDVQALCLAVGFGLVHTSGNRRQCMLLELFIPLDKLYIMSVV